MSNIFKKESKGFTLIEVVIVLAIAALIILVVLQAVGSAQKANRDAARKSEAGRIVSLLEQYASNNGGTYPTTAALFASTIQTYDPNLYAKYQGPAASAAGAGFTSLSCANPVTPQDFEVVYTVGAGNRTYVLSECLEAGNSVVVPH